MTINLDPSNECLNWIQVPKAMQFHAPELQMSQEFSICQQQAVWRWRFCIIAQRVKNKLATPVGTISTKAKTGELSYHIVEQHRG